MRVGVPKEIKNREYRVGLVPCSVRELTNAGHEVLVEHNAGMGIGFDDDAYQAAGARIVPDAKTVFADAQLIIKVKEPQPEECKMLQPHQTLFTFLHLAPDPVQADLLMKSGCTAIAYETVTQPQGGLPLLTPSSEVAGRMSIQAGARCLEKTQGGRGLLLGGVPGVAPAKVLVLGGGVVGSNAIQMAMGAGADVTVIDKHLPTLRRLYAQYSGRLKTVHANEDTINTHALDADLIIGAVLVPGATAPKLLSADILQQMRDGSVLVDVSIDQGGCFATSRPTTADEPTFIEHGIVHYCVVNMPGAAPYTSTFALNNATQPFVMALAQKGVERALREDPHLLAGLNVRAGQITHHEVAESLGKPYVNPITALEL